MTNMLTEQIWDKIKEYDRIIIHRHEKPDPDALGSQGGLKELIAANFPNKEVFVVGEEVDSLTFLTKMDHIDDSAYQGALVIVCDTANTPRISDDRFDKGDFLIKIDHHPNREPYGDLQWVDTTFSSTSEMVMDLYLTVDAEIQLNLASARLLYAGIIGDTGRFLYNNTTKRTLEYAGQLLAIGVDAQEIFTNMYRTSRETAKLNGYILQNFVVTEKGVASISLTEPLLKAFHVTPAEASNLVNTLSNIDGNHIWVLFTGYEKEIRTSIRSSKTVINEVAQQFGGGGHPLASGATVYSMEEAQNLLDALDALLT